MKPFPIPHRKVVDKLLVYNTDNENEANKKINCNSEMFRDHKKREFTTFSDAQTSVVCNCFNHVYVPLSLIIFISLRFLITIHMSLFKSIACPACDNAYYGKNDDL